MSGMSRAELLDCIADVQADRDRHACNAVELMRQRDELLEALNREVSEQNCTCRLLGYVGEKPPCRKCQLEAIIAKTKGRTP
jgi:hypothetical protein